MIKYRTRMEDLLQQVKLNEKQIIEAEDPQADNANIQLDKRIAQVKAQIASLQQVLDNLQDRKRS